MKDYAWQIAAVLRFAKAAFCTIVAACGTGKTRVGIKLALAKNLPTIVITPKNISRQWRDDILSIAGDKESVWLYDAPTEHKDPDKYAYEFEKWLRS